MIKKTKAIMVKPQKTRLIFKVCIPWNFRHELNKKLKFLNQINVKNEIW
jgi:hypothetical protein